MFFITNRRLVQSPRSQAGRMIDFDLADNEALASIFFARRFGHGVYEELTAVPFFDRLRGSHRRNILIHLHGPGMMPEDVFTSAMEIQRGLDAVDGSLAEVVPMIWPCGGDFGHLRDHWDDRAAAERSGLALARAMRKLVAWREARTHERCGIEHIDVLPHSLGNRVLCTALRHWAEDHGSRFDLLRFVFEDGIDDAEIAAPTRHRMAFHAAEPRSLSGLDLCHLAEVMRTGRVLDGVRGRQAIALSTEIECMT